MGDFSRTDSLSLADRLLGRVAEGDRGAFEALYRETADTVFGICVQLLRDRSEAEDVLQEVFVAVWQKARHFDAKRSHAMTWLGSIARHRAIDRLRSHASSGTRAPLEDAVDVTDPAPTAADLSDLSSDRARLNRCFAELDERRRHLIRVAFFEGLTYQELAERVRAPLGSVKSWIRRGLVQLKACLEP